MKRWSNVLVVVAGLAIGGLASSEAHAQWYARGTFNDWSTDNPLIHQDGVHYSAMVTGLVAGQAYEYKIADAGWNISYPGSDGRVIANPNGIIIFHLHSQMTWDDGWSPMNTRRVGYSDPGHDWDIAGTMNGWAGGSDWRLATDGNGLYEREFELTAGIYEFKFRKFEDWGISIGNDFGNSADNIVYNAFADGLYNFQLDLPNGRWRVHTDMEPPIDPLDQWFIRGEFNGWSTANQMTAHGDDYYSGVINGLTPGVGYEFKVTTQHWTVDYPGSNARVIANDAGEAVIHFRNRDSWHDNWEPSTHARVGYDAPGHGWEIAGSMNDWGGGSEFEMSPRGNGVYRAHFPLEAEVYEFKFRKTGDWDVSIGGDFGNVAGNIQLVVDEDGRWAFELDLPNGRWRTFFVPGGDATIDGTVTIADLGILAGNWQQSDRTWEQGDFNGDGIVNIADLGILAGNWQYGVSSGASVSFAEALAMFDVFAGVVVPEPAAVGLVGLVGVVLLGRRRK